MPSFPRAIRDKFGTKNDGISDFRMENSALHTETKKGRKPLVLLEKPWICGLCITIGVTGFEPATSWSQTRRSSQTEPHPALLSFSVFPERKIKYTPVFPKCQHLFIKISKKILRPPEGLFPSRYRRACGLPGGDKTGCPD